MNINNVGMTHVPQLKVPRLADILTEARKHVNIDDYMLEMMDDKLLSRDLL